MKNKFLYILLIILCVFVYITGLFPDVGIDSGKYAAVSRHMYESGDLIHLKIHDEPYMQKPLLFFWLSSLSFSVFGLSMFAFKLPSLLFSFLGVYSTFRLAKLFYGKSVGIISAIVYATSQMLFLYSNDLHTDALLTANIIFGTWQLASYIKNNKYINLILGFTGIGLAMITKGPIGLAVPAFAIGGHLIIKKEWKKIFSFDWLLAVPILAIILYPTLKGIYDQFGPEGIRFYFLTNNIGRITGKYSGTSTDYFFYFHTIIYIFLPWSLYVFIAFFVNAGNLKHKNKRHVKRTEYMTYSAIIIYVFILSISRQKAPHYLFPLIPFLSIITADLINKVAKIDSMKRIYNLMKVFRTTIIILVWSLILTVLFYVFPTTRLFIWIPLIIIFLLLIFSFSPRFTKKEVLIIPLVITSIGINFVINAHFMPSAFKYNGAIQASRSFNELAAENDMLYTYEYNLFETYYYPKNVSVRIYNTDELKQALSGSDVWFITTQEGYEEIVEIAGNRIAYESSFLSRKISELNFNFFNPSLREKDMKNLYLLKII